MLAIVDRVEARLDHLPLPLRRQTIEPMPPVNSGGEVVFQSFAGETEIAPLDEVTS